jgi:hypothetical protein
MVSLKEMVEMMGDVRQPLVMLIALTGVTLSGRQLTVSSGM